MSNRFDISLDTFLKEDSKMVAAIDRERALGTLKREKSIIDFFTGAGIGLVMIGIGWYKKAKYDKTVFNYMAENETSQI